MNMFSYVWFYVTGKLELIRNWAVINVFSPGIYRFFKNIYEPQEMFWKLQLEHTKITW
jgi:hypothetical protein